jgi:hypothetical protein
MKRKFQIPVLFFACSVLIFSGSDLMAQGNSQIKGKGHGNKQKEYKVEAATNGQGNKAKPAKAYKTTGKGNAKKFPNATPRSFKVPPGHYPAAGYYRIWYSGRPPGQQPAPVRYGMPNNAPITPDAFIIYGDQAYDTQYDWRQAEVQKKKSIPREVIDILLGSTTPAQ